MRMRPSSPRRGGGWQPHAACQPRAEREPAGPCRVMMRSCAYPERCDGPCGPSGGAVWPSRCGSSGPCTTP
ncbi:hypothetical protein ADK77_05050 [Streptomyces antibioticus]|nr:hypothetical protein ADK77_05050 [Streptomyces antibioticus]